MSRTKRTPCVGICSTTYGDLVCRGCKRFAHEIVAWNGYEPEQREQIWQRLNHLRDQVVAQFLFVADGKMLESYCQTVEIESDNTASSIYRLLAHLVAGNRALTEAGLQSTVVEQDALEVMKAIDSEIYARSQAHYERNFRVIS